MNYTELVAAIKSFTNNLESEFVANIDTFIKLGEKRIYVTLDLPCDNKNVSGSMSDGNRFLSIPDDVISIQTMNIVASGVYSAVRQKSKSFIREAYPDTTATGQPLFYSIYDHNSVELGPVPDASYSVELTYHGLPTSIVNASTTWMGDNLEDALLYASLAEGYTFMKGDADLIQRYEERYQEEIMKIDARVVKRAMAGNEYERAN